MGLAICRLSTCSDGFTGPGGRRLILSTAGPISPPSQVAECERAYPSMPCSSTATICDFGVNVSYRFCSNLVVLGSTLLVSWFL
eukprot:257678-Amphidinium_carterae.1